MQLPEGTTGTRARCLVSDQATDLAIADGWAHFRVERIVDHEVVGGPEARPDGQHYLVRRAFIEIEARPELGALSGLCVIELRPPAAYG